MSVTVTVPNKFKYALATKQIDFANDTFKGILMQSGFTFNKDTHHAYANVSASELATANGYTVGGQALSGVTVTEDDTDDRLEVTWSNLSWTASSAGITSCALIIFDDTPTTPTADPIVMCIEFGEDGFAEAGSTFVVKSIAFYGT